ncbi:TPA: hypothetical protein RQK66_002622 [Vibrio vulnificus]|uniref:hypothetical protein n=1 Tax=Vibrio parahaemolyticus TaxID=670 RepID=UPI00235DF10C|nr:hypothetical protein [Vibrio parahaemolyticus]HDY7968042.1 hypothetical protein [Vibrio vulnificus]
MIITAKLLKTLKAFSKINTGIKMTTGGRLMTMNPESTIFSIATFPITIDNTYEIYDLREFIKKCPAGSRISVDDDKIKIEYSGVQAEVCSATGAVIPPKKDITQQLHSPFFELNMNESLLRLIKKQCQGSKLHIRAESNVISVVIEEVANVSILAEAHRTTDDFKAVLKTSHMNKLGNGDMKVKIYNNGVAMFESIDTKTVFALESDSTFDKTPVIG